MSSFSSKPPTRISHFELGALLGRGGMGAVYRARDLWSGTEVAIKLLHQELASEGSFRERFVREAHFASLLTSPYTCKLLEYGEVAETHFMVMELVEGKTVRELLAGGPLSTGVALGLARQVALSLEEAEHKGLVHRDIKPDNLKVTQDGRMKVLDFGITRRLKGAAITQTGQFVGTIAYAAPETFLDETEKVDHRADVYSLGATLFHMLAGERPFSSEAPGRLIRDHQQTPPPLEKLASQPESVVEIVRICLEKERDNRYQMFADLIVALEEAERAQPADEPGSGGRPDPTLTLTGSTQAAEPADLWAETQVETRQAAPPVPEKAKEPTALTEAAATRAAARPGVADASSAGAGLSMNLTPQEAQGRLGTSYVLALENDGSSESVVTLSASDQYGACQFILPASAAVPAGGRTDVTLSVSPKARRWLGEPELHSFDVSASDGGGGRPPLTTSGQFEELPFFSGWVGWASLGGSGVAGFAGIAVALLLFLGGGDDGDTSASPPPATSSAGASATLPARHTVTPPPTEAFGPPDLTVDVGQLETVGLPAAGEVLVADTAAGLIAVEGHVGACVDSTGQEFPGVLPDGSEVGFAVATVTDLEPPPAQAALVTCLDTEKIIGKLTIGNRTLHSWICTDVSERVALYITPAGEELPDSRGVCESFDDGIP